MRNFDYLKNLETDEQFTNQLHFVFSQCKARVIEDYLRILSDASIFYRRRTKKCHQDDENSLDVGKCPFIQGEKQDAVKCPFAKRKTNLTSDFTGIRINNYHFNTKDHSVSLLVESVELDSDTNNKIIIATSKELLDLPLGDEHLVLLLGSFDVELETLQKYRNVYCSDDCVLKVHAKHSFNAADLLHFKIVKGMVPKQVVFTISHYFPFLAHSYSKSVIREIEKFITNALEYPGPSLYSQ